MFFCGLVLTCLNANANVVSTVCHGNYYNPGIWDSGNVPVKGDSIYILHNVQFNNSILLNKNYMEVTPGTELCGTHNFVVDSGSYVMGNGTIKADTVFVMDTMVVNDALYCWVSITSGTIIINNVMVVGVQVSCGPFPPDTILNVSACSSYVSPSGNNYTQTGTYYDTLSSVNGCDSVIRIDLNLLNSTSQLNISSCQSYTSPSGQYTWIQSGTYMDTLTNSNNCDSIITINLTIHQSSNSTISKNSCDSLVSPSGNYTWFTSGTYLDTLQNSFGCDSIITVNLTISQSSYNQITDSACNSYSSPSGTYTWEESGIYYDTLINSRGCDSIMQVNLSILNNRDTINPSACWEYVSPDGNETWTQSGVYSDTLINSLGCDSIITVNLAISGDTSHHSVETCGSYVSPAGKTIENSGYYTDTLTDSSGCDSIISYQLTVLKEGGNLKVPNVFSPNSDGINDLFIVDYPGEILMLNYKIYNRWGQLIFENHGIKEGWNGHTYEGLPVPEGVYYYHVDCKAKDCGETKTHQVKGPVNLIR